MASSRKTAHHEFRAHTGPTEESSDRQFGWVIGGALAVFGAWPLWHGLPPRWWALVTAGVVILFAWVWPRALHPLNVVWMRFGLLLSRVTSPVILGVVFFLVVTPTGLMLRAFGRRPLELQWEPAAHTYWKSKAPPGPPPESMSQQF